MHGAHLDARSSDDHSTSVEFRTGIQSHYDTECARMKLGDRLGKEVKVPEPVA
jgi:hypothetical protein